MTPRSGVGTAVEILLWWAALLGLWLVLISAIDGVELFVGTAVALVGAVSAAAARRAVQDR